ncbi:two component transcriptional regulator, LuxR family [Pseudonocardia ammonioxydans]|uniref:Two component transcriptional regulator, LuxR family n=1 Tax=Pseudonocardia ammonioxydans TaxID=260086 RepID=A0A1I5F0K9_PSUAM|nr:response regulator transcription factor [Pseudonocardia ammonioxydans]SFO17200.1 two component transcriptional regulator, LuxR family [Pseudonocardia ammonioxydans]
MIDIVLTDDHPVVRAGIRAVVETEPDMHVVRECATTDELVSWITTGGRADVVLLDLRFGSAQRGGVDATRDLVAAGGPPILILTTYDTDGDILAAVEAGATGYLLKDAPTEELTAAIRAAAAGETTLGPTIQQRLLTRLRRPDTSLTLRELDVLRLVSDGRSNDAIARELSLSRATVKSHLAHVYNKLGVQSRTAALSVARGRGIL